MDDAAATTTSSRSEAKPAPRARSVAEVEIKRRKFIDLANGRVRRAIMAVRVVANIAKLTASKDVFAEDDAELIISTLADEVERAAKRLRNGVTGHQLDIEFDLGAERV